MKNIYLLIIVIFCCSLPAFADKDEDEDYKLVWYDEFDTEGIPNSSDWSFEEGYVRNREAQWYQAQNAYCRNGVLTLTARKEVRPNPDFNSKSRDWRKLRPQILYTSSSITTKDKREYLYGRFEVRARIPATPGSWPTIRLLGKKYTWPSCGEINLMEYTEYHGVKSILASVCWAGNEDTSEWDIAAYPFSKFTDADPLWASKFHVWRLDWDHNSIKLYVDDILLNETSLMRTYNAQNSAGADDNPFETPMHIVLSLAMGSSGGYIEEQTLPINFDIDYIKVYQKP